MVIINMCWVNIIIGGKITSVNLQIEIDPLRPWVPILVQNILEFMNAIAEEEPHQTTSVFLSPKM